MHVNAISSVFTTEIEQAAKSRWPSITHVPCFNQFSRLIMEPYRYEPIDLATDAIRLMRLFKGIYDEPIQCDLFQAYLSTTDRIPYEALSYTWGESSERCDITVQERTFGITSNLHEALRHLRSADQDRVLWVDAICINQDNPAEKGHQVGQMRLVYQMSDTVLVWLGPGNDDVSALMTFAQEYHRRSLRRSAWREEASKLIREDGGQDTDLHRRRLRGLRYMLAQRWFCRVWVLQEVASARSAAIICGWKSVSTRSFTWMLNFLNVQIEPHAKAVLDIMPGPRRDTSWWNKDRDLLTLLRRFRSSESTDPRDLIYALLGIASDACESSILRPDYEITFRQLIQKATAYLLFGDSTHGGIFTCPAWDEQTFLDSRDELQHNLLVWALENGSSQLALSLAKRYDMDPNCIVAPGRPLLCFLARDATYWKKKLVSVVLEHSDVDVNIEDGQHDTPLSLAIRSGNFALTERLLARQDVDVNTTRGSLGPPLVAAMSGTTEINTRESVPMAGISARYRSVERTILDRTDVDVNVRNGQGIGPLDIAAERGDVDLVQLLLDKGAKTRPTPKDGNHAMCSAAEKGFTDIIWLLLSHNADVEATGVERKTPLWTAARHGQSDAVKILTAHHANINRKGGTAGSTPLFEASRGGHETVVVKLLALGADVSARTNLGGSTPLIVATQEGHVGVVTSLLRHNADPMAEDAYGRTALTFNYNAFRSLAPGPSPDRATVGMLTSLLLSQARRQGVDEAKLQEVVWRIDHPSSTVTTSLSYQ